MSYSETGRNGSAGERQIEAGMVLLDPERVRLGEAGGEFGGAAGAAKAEALHGVDAGGAQEQVLLGGFHALGGHLHAETTAEAHHGMHNRGRVGCALDREHEAPVDLELVEGEAPQIEQARIAGAKVVERKLHAERLEAEHRELGGVDV